MRKVFMVLSLASVSVFSQETRVGLGVSLDKTLVQLGGGGSVGSMASIDVLPVSFATFSIPILINGAAKVEPEIGYVRFGTSVDDPMAGDYESAASYWQLALGISGGKRVDNLLYLFGLRGGLIRQSSSYEQGSVESESSQMSFHVGPILGAEYFFHPRASLGAQVGLSYIHVGEAETETDDPDGIGEDEDVSQYMLGNSAKLSLRWYY